MDKAKSVQSENIGMGTVISYRVYGEQAEEALQAAVREAVRETVRLEGILSRFIPDSEISRVNNSAGIRCEKVSGDTYEVLSRAAELSGCCQGCFDVTIGPLVALWASAKAESRPPDESGIGGVLPLVDYTDMVLDPCKKTAGLKRQGQSIDLGGIGKGFAADRVLGVFRKHDITSAFTNFGGNVAAIGSKPDGSPWHIGIRHPRKTDALIGVVSVAGRSVVTSGDYQRYFTGGDGKRHHHILDPNTGYPSESGLISVTIVADSSADADALSTIVFTAGMVKGIGILKSFPGAEAVLVDEDLSVHVTQGLKDCFRAAEGIETRIINLN